MKRFLNDITEYCLAINAVDGYDMTYGNGKTDCPSRKFLYGKMIGIAQFLYNKNGNKIIPKLNQAIIKAGWECQGFKTHDKQIFIVND